jgi:hypothetical protein
MQENAFKSGNSLLMGEINFQKRKTCRNGVEHSAHKGFVEKGLMGRSPCALFSTAISDAPENARIAGSE